MSNEQNNQPSFLGRVLRFIGCLLIILLVIAALGAGGYFGAPYLYRQYIQPVQQHTIRLDELETILVQNEQLAVGRLDEFASRLESLEVQVDSNKEGIAAMESRLASLETSQATQADFQSEIAGQLDGLQTSIEKISSEQETLQKDLSLTNADIKDLETSVGGFQADLDDTTSTVKDLEKQVQALNDSVRDQDEKLQAMQNEIQMLKVMELLTRARMFITQGNLTLARADIQQASELLADLSSQVPENQQETLLEIIARLDEVLEIMSRSPIQAADKLEAAWQLLVEGLPREPAP